jgi:transcriptional regulator with XRE-family HTH domain
MVAIKNKQRGKEQEMDNLKEKIWARFRTQEKFAVASGIDESIVSKYVRGIRKPSPKHAEIIKRLLVEPKK